MMDYTVWVDAMTGSILDHEGFGWSGRWLLLPFLTI